MTTYRVPKVGEVWVFRPVLPYRTRVEIVAVDDIGDGLTIRYVNTGVENRTWVQAFLGFYVAEDTLPAPVPVAGLVSS